MSTNSLLSTQSVDGAPKSLTTIYSDNPAEEKILCESRCSPVTIPHRHEINKVIRHERYQAAFNNVFRYQQQTDHVVLLCPQCCLTDSQSRLMMPPKL